jgi:hypothetical protein
MQFYMVLEPRDFEFKIRLTQYKIKILHPTFDPRLSLMRKPHVRESIEAEMYYLISSITLVF